MVRNTVYVAIILLSVVVCYLGFVRGMRFFLVPSESMEPTLLPRDYILTLRDEEYRRGDIVVIRDPTMDRGYLVKRIVGVGGDTVGVAAGALFLNGRYVSEPYTREPMAYEVYPAVQVPPGELYLLGDNRNNSDDSSNWAKPTVPLDAVIGRVRYVYLPGSRRGPVRSFPVALMLDGGG